jgi:hypothetical protein
MSSYRSPSLKKGTYVLQTHTHTAKTERETSHDDVSAQLICDNLDRKVPAQFPFTTLQNARYSTT